MWPFLFCLEVKRTRAWKFTLRRAILVGFLRGAWCANNVASVARTAKCILNTCSECLCVLLCVIHMLLHTTFCDVGITITAIFLPFQTDVIVVPRVSLPSFWGNVRDRPNFALVGVGECSLLWFCSSPLALELGSLGPGIRQTRRVEYAVTFLHNLPVHHQACNLGFNLQEVFAHRSTLSNLWVYTLSHMILRTHTPRTDRFQ